MDYYPLSLFCLFFVNKCFLVDKYDVLIIVRMSSLLKGLMDSVFTNEILELVVDTIVITLLFKLLELMMRNMGSIL